jgi:hypothetical protein
MVTKEEGLSYDDLVLNAYKAIQNSNFEKAIHNSESALKINSKEPDAYGSRGIAYLGKSEKVKALKDLKTTIEILNKIKNVVLTCRNEQEFVDEKEYNLIKFTEYQSNSSTGLKLLAQKNIDAEIKHFEELLQELLQDRLIEFWKNEIENYFEKAFQNYSQNNPAKGSFLEGGIVYSQILNLANELKKENKKNKENVTLTDKQIDLIIDEIRDKILKKYMTFLG